MGHRVQTYSRKDALCEWECNSQSYVQKRTIHADSTSGSSCCCCKRVITWKIPQSPCKPRASPMRLRKRRSFSHFAQRYNIVPILRCDPTLPQHTQLRSNPDPLGLQLGPNFIPTCRKLASSWTRLRATSAQVARAWVKSRACAVVQKQHPLAALLFRGVKSYVCCSMLSQDITR